MTTSASPFVERVARLLAVHDLRRLGDGDVLWASETVDQIWPDHVAEAIAFLELLREPTGAMLRFGGAGTWRRMLEVEISGEGADAPRRRDETGGAGSAPV